MKSILYNTLFLSLMLSSCSSSQRILYARKSPAAVSLKYNKIFVVALVYDQEVRRYIEDRLAG